MVGITTLIILAFLSVPGNVLAETEAFISHAQFEEFDRRMAERFETTLESSKDNFDHVNERIDRVDKRIDRVDKHMNEGFDRIHTDMRQMRQWSIFVLVSYRCACGCNGDAVGQAASVRLI